MIDRRFASIALLWTAVVCLAACSASTSGHGSPGGSGGAGTTSHGVTGAAPRSTPAHAAGLAALMQRGAASITTAHLTLDITAGSQRVQGAGDEMLSGARLSALELSETIGQVGTLRLLIVDGHAFAALPAALNHSGKPWVLVSGNSHDRVVKQLNTSIGSARDAASLSTAATFVRAAKSVKLDGPDPVNGADATHYSIVVDVAKLPSAYPGRQTLISAGLTTLPVELWIDGQGRPVKVSEKFSVQGQTISSLITLSRFNAPVHITAPPADEVSTS